MIVDICFSPALFPFYTHPNDVVAVTDIFRATTTMCTAFLNGASAIIPVATMAEAEQYKSEGFLVGTLALQAAKNSRELLIGAFSNIDVVVDKCVELGGRVVVLCAGWNNKVNTEDMLFAGAFAEKICEKTETHLDSDGATIALNLWQMVKIDPLAYIQNTEHYHRLVANGLERDAKFCLQHNTVALVPFYGANGRIRI